MKSAIDELESYLDREASSFADALMKMARADWFDRDALDHLARLIQRTLILADLNGRKRMLMEADALRKRTPARFAAESPIAPGLTFDEAVEDLLKREPRLAESAAEVAELYSWSGVFALAKSASINLTRRVQQALGELLSQGKAAESTREELQRMAAEEAHDWTVSYASTIYRTNVAHAYNMGRMKQAQDPDVADVIPALEYVSMEDERTRPNHWAAHGLVAGVNDTIWTRMRPPQGYQCRCVLRQVSIMELERRGLIRDGQVVRFIPDGFSKAGPDEGFKPGVL